MSQDYNPVQFLEEIVFFDGTSTIMSSFLNNKELLDDGFFYIQEHEQYLKDEIIEYPNSNTPDWKFEAIDKKTFYLKYLNSNKKTLIAYLKNIQNDSDFDTTLKTIYNSLHAVITKLNNSSLRYQEILETFLITLIQDLKTLFQSTETHKVFRILNKSEGLISFFQCKDIKASFFEKLYDLTFELSLIDDIVVSYETFYDVLNAVNPNPEENKVIFKANNHIIAFYLKEIEPFFNNFNAITIERSKCFYNKQNKLLTSTDLYTSLSRNKDKNTETLMEISKNIDKLKKTYLK